MVANLWVSSVVSDKLCAASSGTMNKSLPLISTNAVQHMLAELVVAALQVASKAVPTTSATLVPKPHPPAKTASAAPRSPHQQRTTTPATDVQGEGVGTREGQLAASTPPPRASQLAERVLEVLHDVRGKPPACKHMSVSDAVRHLLPSFAKHIAQGVVGAHLRLDNFVIRVRASPPGPNARDREARIHLVNTDSVLCAAVLNDVAVGAMAEAFALRNPGERTAVRKYCWARSNFDRNLVINPSRCIGPLLSCCCRSAECLMYLLSVYMAVVACRCLF